MNKWFNIKRFWLVLRHEFANAWIELAVFVTISLVFLFAPYKKINSGIVESLVIMAAFGYMVYYLAFSARQFANMQSTERRIGFLTLPASNVEKFYSRLLLYWLLPTLFFILPVVLLPFAPQTKVYIGYLEPPVLIFFFAIWAVLIIESSLAVLFGTIFRKGGLLILLLVETVIVIGIVIYTRAYPWVINNLDFSIVARVMEYVGVDRPDMGRALKVAAMVAVPPTVFNIALARIIFSRKRLSRPLVNIDEQ